MKKMRHIHVAVLVAACASLTVATAMWACSPFSGADSTAPDGATPNTASDGGADGGVSVDFDTCANRIHVTEGFEGAGFPPAKWIRESYRAGDAGRETAVVNSGNGSLKGSVAVNDAGSAGMIGYVLPDKNVLPRGVRLRYAYKHVASEFQGKFYGEVGCTVAFATSVTNNAFLFDIDGTETGVAIGTANETLANLFDKDVWHRVSHELRFDTAAGPGDAGVALDTIVSEADGANMVSAHLNASLSGNLLPIQILCGIPFAKSEGATLYAYVDDIAIDVCP